MTKKKKPSPQKILRQILLVLMTIFAAVAAVIFLLPTVLTITNSFMSQTEINANYGVVFNSVTDSKTFISKTVNLKFIPDIVSFSQYFSVLFKTPDYLLKFWNSAILTVPIVIFQTVVALFASYGFSRLTGKLKEIIFFVYIILMLMPYQVTLVPNYLVSEKLGILDTRWAIILPGIFSPFAVFLLTKAMKRIPKTYFEAAMLDGANELQIFTSICYPMVRSAVFSVLMLVFIDYWNMVEQPLILLSDESMHPLSVFLSKINSGDTGLAFAVAVIYMMPSLLMFLYGEDYLVEGITYSGGIKG
ncbi:carbohydrate ABC transporter permease [Huintestinicola butyrica]|uniref:carbohydrate ABC transporter permease n=1 Tax=Huintestinicola butyrica TaxID=2981728 RepID=UPI003F7D3AAC